jgi:hypothetical protein
MSATGKGHLNGSSAKPRQGGEVAAVLAHVNGHKPGKRAGVTKSGAQRLPDADTPLQPANDARGVQHGRKNVGRSNHGKLGKRCARLRKALAKRLDVNAAEIVVFVFLGLPVLVAMGAAFVRGALGG